MARQQGLAMEQVGAYRGTGGAVRAVAQPPEAQALRRLLLRRGNQEMWNAKF